MSDPVWTPEILRHPQQNKRDSSYWGRYYKELIGDFINRSGIHDKAEAQTYAEDRANGVLQLVCDARNSQGIPNSKDGL